MTGAPSGDAPLAHERRSAGAMRRPGVATTLAVSEEVAFDRVRLGPLRRSSPAGTRSSGHEIVVRRGGGDDRKRRLSETLRIAFRLAIAIVTLIVCAGFASHKGGTAHLVAASFGVAAGADVAAASDVTFGVAAPATANADWGVVLPFEPRQHWQHGDSRPVVELNAVEADDNDEKDPLCDAFDAAPSFRFVPVPREPGRALRGALPIDTSRFAAGPGLPRGPPA